MNKKIVVYGASGHGKVVADAAESAGFEVVGFADDMPDKKGITIERWKVTACGIDEIAKLHPECCVALGIGDNKVRKRVFENLIDRGMEITTVIHSSAIVSTYSTIKTGVVIFAGAIVNPGSVVGEGAIINTAATIDHDSNIGQFAHLSPGVHMGGTVNIGEGTHVGVGVTVKNNIEIGDWSMIGAGAVVVSNIPNNTIAYGVPAKRISTKS